jgi:AcrR family transcriptional regulator
VPRILTDDEVNDFRRRVCETAERLFAEHGPEAVSMRQLAAELGVSPMTPYRYFKDKDDILAAARTSGFDRFSQALEAAFASASDPRERSNAVGEAYVRFAFDHPAAYRLMFDLSQPTEAHYPDLVRASQRAWRTLGAHIGGLVDAGLIEGDPQMVGLVFWAAVHGLVVLRLAGKLPPGAPFEAVLRETQRALGRGFSPRPAPGS